MIRCLSIVKHAYRSNSAYRVNIVINIVSALSSLYIMIAIWNALYSKDISHTHTLEQTVTYTILQSAIFSAFHLYPGRRIAQSVYNGNIAIDLLRPVPLLSLHYAHELGNRLFRWVTLSIPTVIVASISYSILPPYSAACLLAFLVTSILGIALFSLFDCIVSYTAFWIVDNWYVNWFEGGIIAFFGGTTVPLWFYPKRLQGLLDALPFKYMSYSSIDIYLGNVDASGIFRVLYTQSFWILLFICIERIIWLQAKKKLVVNGG